VTTDFTDGTDWKEEVSENGKMNDRKWGQNDGEMSQKDEIRKMGGSENRESS
jgi:hypothetical protein